MSITHCLEYSRSSRSTCHGPAPCNGSNIEPGTLRYGRIIPGKFNDTVEWRHWGCVTPDILANLASVGSLARVRGFEKLKADDQTRVQTAVARRFIDPVDIPASAKAPAAAAPAPSATPAMSQKKRKAAFEAAHPSSQATAPSSSQPSSSQPLRPLAPPTASQYAEEEIEQDVPEEEARDELYCTMSTSVVGVQYYNGLVGAGEEVRLIREPHNKYDHNAIQVKNIGHHQVGHIPRNVAGRLAPLLDRNAVTVEGVMQTGNLKGKSYSLGLTLKIYGPSDKRSTLEPQLVWATPGQRGFPPRTTGASSQRPPQSTQPAYPSSTAASSSMAPPATQKRAKAPTAQQLAQQEAARKQQEALRRAHELKQMLTTLEKVDDEGRRSSLLDTLCSTDDILNLPLHPAPPSIDTGELVVNLLKHQSQALQWCIEHEYPVLPKTESDRPVQFWQFRKSGNKPYYYNIATKSPQEAPPVLGRGALCADSMGLGKTLTMLALIIATRKDTPTDFAKSTLIVAPLSILSNWEKQIEDHCTPGTLTYCIYYGSKRTMTPEQLAKYDVVITTYQTVAGEHTGSDKTDGEPSKKKKKVSKGLFDVQWKRIILDEGHQIRNPRTKMAKAVSALNAQRRWVLSGTPIINSPQDLGSILTFLQICRPLDNQDFYKRLLLRPLKDGDPAGAELLRALMSHICIRRTKEMQDSEGNSLVPLPPVEMTLVPVALHPDARELYDAVELLSKERVEDIINRNGGINPVVQSNVLSMLTRLRQLALHPGLLPANYLEQLRAAEQNEDAPHTTKQLTPQERIHMQNLLAKAIEDCEECPICFNILEDPRITSCAHPFCLACITEVISRDPKCPMDRRPLGLGDLIEPPPPTDLTQAPVRQDEPEDEDDMRSTSSAKIDQLVHLLKLTPGTEKSLVFSQFTSFLDKIAEVLEEQGIPYVRFDGQMSQRRRQETLASFSVPIEEEPIVPIVADSAATSSQRTRRRSSTQSVLQADSSFDHDGDDDFVMTAAGEDDDDDFLDDEDDDGAFASKSRKGKGKGKAKAKGKGKAKAKAGSRASIRAGVDGSSFAGENPRVMLISLKAGALGLNLTVANNVYLMDPWWQEGIESQAIDRVNRIGQKKPVHVYQLIAENTVESKVIDIQERKKALIQQAFSGIKRTETPRQKKEARLQDLIELFGIRQQTASQTAA
ncbi:hypothetical protein PLICRDRAFT_133581 [Plicaturopsis crispa FD-325 SS-3]|nr:hypothetical protein PLICRDRAFT_133581 [Plicaturopsis crispa FD-325 SS-3]